MNQRTLRPLVLLGALLMAAGVLYGCAQGSVIEKAPPVTSSPEAVLEAYWTAVAQRDRDAQDALKSQYLLEEEARWREQRGVQAPVGEQKIDVGSIQVSITSVAERADLASHPDERYRSYWSVANGSVRYVITDGNEFENAGRSTKFATLVRETPESPWRIDAVGTGP